MFDFAWSEFALIGVVALVAIGPKDMPVAIRTVAGMIKKARRMASEFQTHVDDLMREADLGDVKQAFNDIRNMDLSAVIEKHVDPDGSLRETLSDNPLGEDSFPGSGGEASLDEVAVDELAATSAEPGTDAVRLASSHAPAFIPPGLIPIPAAEPEAHVPEAPAFIPPEVVQQRHYRA